MRTMPLPRTVRPSVGAVLVAPLLILTLGAAGPAVAQPDEAALKMKGFYEMPFPCGQAWTGSTRSSHSPSSKAVDWNRPDDDGDDVVAASAGTVTVASKTGRSGYGRYVQITHPNGETTLYGHLSLVTVAVGQAVDQGAMIGKVGSTGNSTGPHLHFEERSGSKVRTAAFSGQKFKYGSTRVSRNCVDVPLAANMVGTAAAEQVIFRRDQLATFQVQQPGAAPIVIQFGVGTDDPLLGDWDGNGVADVGVRRASENLFHLSVGGTSTVVSFGVPTDRPIAGDWNGDGRTDIGVHRASAGTFFQRSPDGAVSTIALGDANDIPVTGDWDGDRVSDVGVYDSASATFTLRFVSTNGTVWVGSIQFGVAGDLPVVGDWDGNGVTDLGVWRPGTGSFFGRRAPSARATVNTISEVAFGRPRLLP